MRTIPHDRLVIVTSEENTRSEDFARIMEAGRMAGEPVETVLVDKFDLMSAFQAMVEAFRRREAAHEEVAVNISGGTQLLADAALLAAFHTGVECYHIAESARRLPVLRGVEITDPLTKGQKDALLTFEEGMSIAQAMAMAKGRHGLMEDLMGLRRAGAIESRQDGDQVRLHLTRKGERMLRPLSRRKRDEIT